MLDAVVKGIWEDIKISALCPGEPATPGIRQAENKKRRTHGYVPIVVQDVHEGVRRKRTTWLHPGGLCKSSVELSFVLATLLDFKDWVPWGGNGFGL